VQAFPQKHVGNGKQDKDKIKNNAADYFLYICNKTDLI